MRQVACCEKGKGVRAVGNSALGTRFADTYTSDLDAVI
jgi:hypothetical protein